MLYLYPFTIDNESPQLGMKEALYLIPSPISSGYRRKDTNMSTYRANGPEDTFGFGTIKFTVSFRAS
jgi:hypothetical protein